MVEFKPVSEGNRTSMYFLALSQAPPVLEAEIAICATVQRLHDYFTVIKRMQAMD